jgi:uncharacterized delta-60 repeat protein
MIRQLNIIFFTFWTLFTSAQSGTLDLTFNGTGIATTDLTGYPDGAQAVAIQTDGKIVVVGHANDCAAADFGIVRYNVDGTIDSNFGNNGQIITPFGTNDDRAFAVALQTDGKIVVAGYSYEWSIGFHIALARYNYNGSLDSTFGIGGKVLTIGLYNATSLAIQGDKIIVGGCYGNLANMDFAILRYNNNGSLDTTFGVNGIVITDINNSQDHIYGLAIQSDFKIVAVGDTHFSVARYNSDGALDTTFGYNGIVTTQIGNYYEQANAVALQTDGKIVVAGYSRINGVKDDFALLRLNTNGTIDSAFGSYGKITTSLNIYEDRVYSVVVQLDGKILAGGYSATNDSTYHFTITRYNTDGAIDITFGNIGEVITPIGTSLDAINGLALQNDGKIIAVGYAFTDSVNSDFAIARYNPSSVGLEEMTNENKILIFPNPVSNKFSIVIGQPTILQSTILSIYNISGQLLIEQTIRQNKSEIDISGLAKGVYIIKLNNSNTTFVARIIKE